jgi:hypothetical protein
MPKNDGAMQFFHCPSDLSFSDFLYFFRQPEKFWLADIAHA